MLRCSLPLLVLALIVFVTADREVVVAQATHVHDHATSTPPGPQEASGTSWLPSPTPMYALHRQWSDWDLMAHGNGFVQFLYESGAEHHRGHQFGSINWMMAMGHRQVGSGSLELRGMFSLE